MKLKIRQGTFEDADFLAEIEGLCFPKDEAAKLEDFKRRLTLFEDSFFIGELDGKIIAFVNGAVTDSKFIYDDMYHEASEHNPEGEYQAIFGICTHPDYQRLGMAGLMMTHIINATKKRGKKGLILTCKEHLIHFYEQFGFVNKGVSKSSHGGAVWYDMILEFSKN